MSADSDTTFENLEQVERSIERGVEEQEDRAEEVKQAHDDEQAIIDAIQRDTVTVRLKGKPLEFTPLLGDEEDFIDGIMEKYGPGGEFDGIEEDDLEGGELAEVNALKARMVDTLTEHNQDEGKYGREFWQKVPQAMRSDVVNQIREGGEETERTGN